MLVMQIFFEEMATRHDQSHFSLTNYVYLYTHAGMCAHASTYVYD